MKNKILAFSLLSIFSINSIGQVNLYRIPSDPKATYEVLEKTGKGKKRIITTKRTGPSGASYSKREYDCELAKVRYIETGETLQEMQSSKLDSKLTGIVDGSIASYIGGVACEGYKQ